MKNNKDLKRNLVRRHFAHLLGILFLVFKALNGAPTFFHHYLRLFVFISILKIQISPLFCSFHVLGLIFII